MVSAPNVRWGLRHQANTHLAELVQPALLLIDGLDPFLGLGVASLESVLEGRQPGVELEHSCGRVSQSVVDSRLSLSGCNEPVPSLGMSSSATLPPATNVFDEFTAMGSIFVGN